MLRPTPLNPAELAEAADRLPGWSVSAECLSRTLKLRDFNEALGLIVRIGLLAECLNHHPEIHSVYSTLTLRLSTHDAGDRTTALDVELALRIQGLLS